MQADKAPAWRSPQYTPRRWGWKRIKRRIRQMLAPVPALERLGVDTWRRVRFLAMQGRWKFETRIGGLLRTHVRDVDVDRIYWVSPEKIVFSAMQEFHIHECKGRILGGDWDQLGKRFDSLDLYVAMKQVCVEGQAWTDTAFYQRRLQQLQHDETRRLSPFLDEAGLQASCKSTELLFQRIKEEGFKSQKELFLAGVIQDPMEAEEEVAVCIGRHGDLLFSDGAHRLAAAKLLGLTRIPVKIAVRHAEWMKFRNELALYAHQDEVNTGGILYQPVTHPDLADLAASHPCADRFQLIRDNMSSRNGRLLDIGADLGYFCHRFEEEGFDCWAVENNPNTAYFLERLARAENRKFKILKSSIFDVPEIRATHFDVVLALNIFHHFIKTAEDHDRLLELLQDLQVDEMFFEPQLPGEVQMAGACCNYPPEEFVQLIQSHSVLKSADRLAVMPNGRPLYRLHR